MLLLGQQCASISLDFCPKLLLFQYPPDIVRLASLILLMSQDRIDLALKQAQVDYYIVVNGYQPFLFARIRVHRRKRTDYY